MIDNHNELMSTRNYELIVLTLSTDKQEEKES